jgi:hypothetical protein
MAPTTKPKLGSVSVSRSADTQHVAALHCTFLMKIKQQASNGAGGRCSPEQRHTGPACPAPPVRVRSVSDVRRLLCCSSSSALQSTQANILLPLHSAAVLQVFQQDARHERRSLVAASTFQACKSQPDRKGAGPCLASGSKSQKGWSSGNTVSSLSVPPPLAAALQVQHKEKRLFFSHLQATDCLFCSATLFLVTL